MPLSHTTWTPYVKEKLTNGQIKDIQYFLDTIYQTDTIFPPRDQVFSALVATPLTNTKVIIMGQDPYHEVDQAQGLSFSVPDDILA
ncbi:MAG: uracil-DNA glycosylase, partial [Leuconostoc gelidum]